MLIQAIINTDDSNIEAICWWGHIPRTLQGAEVGVISCAGEGTERVSQDMSLRRNLLWGDRKEGGGLQLYFELGIHGPW